MANLDVTYDELRRVAAALRVGKDELNQKLVELSNMVNDLTASGFQAEHSSAAYRESFEQFRTGTSQAIEGLEGLSTFLTSAADALQQTDESLARQLR